ncbi:MAG: GyrI-like domain-containing protein, partial [Planctomycetaceae bacterium]|nr:GyrI-like domain-containing protein [Planctomycetaceae bacterium]
MKVMVIVKATPSSEAGEMPSTELLTAMGTFNEELVQAGIMQAGEGLHPSSQGARVRFSGTHRIVTDGPFAETKELIAGFWIWKVDSMEQAIDWVKKCPNPMPEESEIEIRPIFEAEDFGSEFTPELREQEAAIRAQTLGLNPPNFVDADSRFITGLNQSYTKETRRDIPQQWGRFCDVMDTIPERTGKDSCGVSWNCESCGSFDYLTGVEVQEGTELPPDITTVKASAGRYAVFCHTKHVSELAAAFDTIWSQWAPDCGLNLNTDAPCFERYT